VEAQALECFKEASVAKRYSKHRNYRLTDGLVLEIEAFAKYNSISESEATRRLLGAIVRTMNDLGTRSLPAQEPNSTSPDR